MEVRSKMAVLSSETGVELRFEAVADVPYDVCSVKLPMGGESILSGCSCRVSEELSCETENG